MAIVLFTDFGSRDVYVGQVKAVIDRESPGVSVIDLLNDAPDFNVRAAAHLLASLVSRFPQGTVFLAVVDPGVGSPRETAVVKADGYRLVGPDNGLLSVFAARCARAERFRIGWRPAELSDTFHGRDLFAPVAARMAAGTLASDELSPIEELSIDFGAADLAEVIYVDHYGNAVTGIRAGSCPQTARLGAHGAHVSHARVFAEVAPGAAFWYENSAGLVEIAVNTGSAAAKLGLGVGDAVRRVL